MSDGFLISLLTKVDSISHTFIFQGYQNLVSTYSPAITALIVLAVVLYGYGIVQGWVNFSMPELSKRALLIGFILSFALNWGNFSKYVYDLFTKAPNEISTQLLPLISAKAFSESGNVNNALQQAFYDGFYAVKATWEQGSKLNILPFLWAMLMSVVLILFIGIALIELIVAKFGLAIYLVLAPIIIPTLLFQPTKALLFDGWLRHLIVFAFIPIFITAALALGLTLLLDVSTQTKTAIEEHSLNLLDVIPYCVCAVICIGLIKKASTMAGALAHGFSTSAAHHVDTAAIWMRTRFRSFTSKK